MSWSTHHNESAALASEAELFLRSGDTDRARELYRRAGELELQAFEETDSSKTRTQGVTIVSAISLLYKAREFQHAEGIALSHLGRSRLPLFAMEQLKDLVRSIWAEEEFREKDIGFAEGEVLVSVSGGRVVTGGAPLELILTKVNEISSYFYRTIEMLLEVPLRMRGAPARHIQEQCRPWLFQAPPGSYQFAVRIQKPIQPELFGDDLPKIQLITDRFIQILDASSREDMAELERVVPEEDYRKTFLKMTRNLAPTGRSYEKIEIKPSSSSQMDKIVLVPESRKAVGKLIRSTSRTAEDDRPRQDVRLVGTLRGLHLDKDWIEVTLNDKGQEEHVKVTRTGEVIDDLVGPMVNRRVVVETILTADGTYIFRDIELDE
jgi:hypothetical protein